MTFSLGIDTGVSILKLRVIFGRAELRRCKLSHVMSSTVRLKLVSFVQVPRLDSLRHVPVVVSHAPHEDGFTSRDTAVADNEDYVLRSPPY
ncbi:MAG: hypothetical protein QOE52_2722 [Mycobacterium sp.]|jgi:hypothetical protein|nr:hypothetical protein [Mycobacterium sp.]MDT5343538.1 hypothetical protein [Mycobacterium sp.]